ncbi:hexose kinase [Microbacterium betulae]|uniref:Hexose kinase n=1 Tax=Microbacterium betulae TaxID=2981139 RepID=A0AA97FGK6_9MICO|nr:hexose kinase [Microbacterium sp. AB]WOF23151.1 hexose kinase [Microbacterium sp. AB]
MARIVVVTPNPAIDVTYRVTEQRIGDTVRVHGVDRRAGGKGVNVVRVLAALGIPAVAVQPLGGASGRWIADALSAERIETVTVHVPAETRQTVAVVDDRAHPTLFAESGHPLSDAAWRRLAAAVGDRAEPGGCVVLSGSVPPRTDPRQVSGVIAAARAAGATVVVDTSGPALLVAAGAQADYVTPNEAEALAASGATTLREGMRALVDAGAGTVVVSRGADGMVALGRDGAETRQVAVPDVHGNPTGAGDAATAGLVGALADGGGLARALRSAAVLGAAAVLAPVAGEIDAAAIDGLRARLGPEPSRPHPSAAPRSPETQR